MPPVSRKLQAGMTIWMLALVLGLIGFFTKVVIGVYPMMYNQYKVRAHLSQLAKDPETAKLDPGEIKMQLMKRFGQVDNVEGISEKDIKVAVDPKTGKMSITVDYEMRTEFFAPIFIVGDFRGTKVDVVSSNTARGNI